MKNKWLILVIFLVATTLFLSIDTSKVKFNGDSQDNYEYYYGEFEEKALDTTTGVIKGITNTFNTISNIFNNVWGFINNLFSNNDPFIENLSNNQGSAIINDFKILEKKQNFLIEYFNFELSGSGYNQIVLIGKNFLTGASSGPLVDDTREEPNYKEFDFVSNSLYSDFGITIYNCNYNLKSVIRKEDIAALNDIDLIIIPFYVQQDNFQLYKSLSEYLDTSNMNKVIDSLKEININFWLIQNVNENETGTIGSWVKNNAS